MTNSLSLCPTLGVDVKRICRESAAASFVPLAITAASTLSFQRVLLESVVKQTVVRLTGFA